MSLDQDQADSLQQYRQHTRVFGHGVPLAKTLKKDARKAGIDIIDDQRREISLHTFRRTFDTQLHLAGVSPLAVQKLMRHKDLKLTTNTYFDAGQMKLREDIEKLPSPLSVSLYVSHNSGKNSPNVSGMENKELSSKKNIDLKDLDLEQLRALHPGFEVGMVALVIPPVALIVPIVYDSPFGGKRKR